MLAETYLLVIRNEENFEEKTAISFNYAKLLVVTTAMLIILFSVSFFLSTTILARWFHPASKESEINKKVLQLSMAVDSLTEQLSYRDKFLQSVTKVVDGDAEFLKEDSLANTGGAKRQVKQADIDSIAPVDVNIRNEFENPSKGVVRMVTHTAGSDIVSPFLFVPLNAGIISQKFNPKNNHYAVDIVAKKDEPVKCVADGTVLFSSWTYDTGHVIVVQHAGNLISVYKHNAVLLKKEGSMVRAGEAIAVIGNSGELTTGPHLHFELWHNSTPVDPEQFISF